MQVTRKNIMQNLEEMSLAELEALVAAAQAILSRRREARAQGLRQEMARMARSAGLSAEEFAVLAS